MVAFRPLLALVLLGLCCTSGCVWVPAERLAASEAKNQSLVAESRALRQRIAAINTHTHDVEDQLGTSEAQLARLEERFGIDRQRLANFKRERVAVRGHLDSLARRGVAIPDGLNSRLQALAGKFPGLYYDPNLGVAKIDSDVLFDSGKAELRPVASELLGELAAVLRGPDAADFKIMVVGHTDDRNIVGSETRQRYPNNFHLSAHRALAVVDQLHREGVPEEQLGLGGFGQHQAITQNDSPEGRQRNRRVEIFLLGPDVPVVGWAETTPSLYR
ncbi:MAG: OmpA family protein [Planctomycetes bacterium]|nr:OmpA family protein [Planctomycetota bacterium]